MASGQKLESLVLDEAKRRLLSETSLSDFLSFTLRGLMGFIAAASVCMALAASVASEIGQIALPLMAFGVGSILASGLMVAWLIWLAGPCVVKFGAAMIMTLRRLVAWIGGSNALAIRQRKEVVPIRSHKSSTFRQRLKTSFWKAGRWSLVLSLLVASSIIGAMGGMARHRHLVELTRLQADRLIVALSKYEQRHGRFPIRLEDLPDPVSPPYLGNGYSYQCVDRGDWCQLQYTVDPLTCFEWTSETKRWTEIPLTLLPMY